MIQTLRVRDRYRLGGDLARVRRRKRDGGDRSRCGGRMPQRWGLRARRGDDAQAEEAERAAEEAERAAEGDDEDDLHGRRITAVGAADAQSESALGDRWPPRSRRTDASAMDVARAARGRCAWHARGS